MAVLVGFDLMGLTSLIEFSFQLFDDVNVASTKKLIFLYVSCFQICVWEGSPEQNCSFLPMETLQFHIHFSLIKTNILLGILPRVLRFSSNTYSSQIFLVEASFFSLPLPYHDYAESVCVWGVCVEHTHMHMNTIHLYLPRS